MSTIFFNLRYYIINIIPVKLWINFIVLKGWGGGRSVCHYFFEWLVISTELYSQGIKYKRCLKQQPAQICGWKSRLPMVQGRAPPGPCGQGWSGMGYSPGRFWNSLCSERALGSHALHPCSGTALWPLLCHVMMAQSLSSWNSYFCFPNVNMEAPRGRWEVQGKFSAKWQMRILIEPRSPPHVHVLIAAEANSQTTIVSMG